jgi:hypothetical protein
MNNYEVKFNWDSERCTHDIISTLDGVELHEGHVLQLKSDMQSYISDASKDAFGSRYRFDPFIMSVKELEDLADYYSEEVGRTIEREERAHAEAEASFESRVANLIESGAGDRATAIRWIRDAHRDDAWCDLDECIRYALGLSWSYDLDHGDRDFFTRKAAKAA